MVEDKVLDLRPKQIRLVPPPLQYRPLMFHPMFRKIIVKLYRNFVSAQMVFRPVILDWMIVVFGPYYDLNRGVVDPCWVDCDAEQSVCVGGPLRPGEWRDGGGSAWCADRDCRDTFRPEVQEPVDELGGQCLPLIDLEGGIPDHHH